MVQIRIQVCKFKWTSFRKKIIGRVIFRYQTIQCCLPNVTYKRAEVLIEVVSKETKRVKETENVGHFTIYLLIIDDYINKLNELESKIYLK